MSGNKKPERFKDRQYMLRLLGRLYDIEVEEDEESIRVRFKNEGDQKIAAKEFGTGYSQFNEKLNDSLGQTPYNRIIRRIHLVLENRQLRQQNVELLKLSEQFSEQASEVNKILANEREATSVGLSEDVSQLEARHSERQAANAISYQTITSRMKAVMDSRPQKSHWTLLWKDRRVWGPVILLFFFSILMLWQSIDTKESYVVDDWLKMRRIYEHNGKLVIYRLVGESMIINQNFKDGKYEVVDSNAKSIHLRYKPEVFDDIDKKVVDAVGEGRTALSEIGFVTPNGESLAVLLDSVYKYDEKAGKIDAFSQILREEAATYLFDSTYTLYEIQKNIHEIVYRAQERAWGIVKEDVFGEVKSK